jgi:hypothetical protein
VNRYTMDVFENLATIVDVSHFDDTPQSKNTDRLARNRASARASRKRGRDELDLLREQCASQRAEIANLRMLLFLESSQTCIPHQVAKIAIPRIPRPDTSAPGRI